MYLEHDCSFIAKTSKKDADTNGDNGTINTTNNKPAGEETHTCFVFISSKLASDITMTIGQAFELAYRRYVSDGSKGSEMTKLQVQTKQLENTVQVYQQRLKDLSELLPKSEVSRLLATYGVRDLLEVPALENGALLNGGGNHKMGSSLEIGTDLLANTDDQLLIETSSTTTTSNVSSKMFAGAPMVPPRNQLQNQINSTLDAFKPSVGTKLEGLLLHSDSDSDFDPRADESDTSSSYTNGGGKQLSNDLFGFEPPSSKTLGQQLFTAPVNGNGVATNGSNGSNGGGPMVNGNGNGYHANPTPLCKTLLQKPRAVYWESHFVSDVSVAPPPKTVTPRRPAANNSGLINNNNGSQDLFGSTPFNAMQPSPFDVSVEASITLGTVANTHFVDYSGS